MKWFYNLKRSLRVVITIAAFAPFVIFAAIVSPSADQGLTPIQMFIGALFIALGVVFLVFAIKASKAERQAAAQKAQAGRESAKNKVVDDNSPENMLLRAAELRRQGEDAIKRAQKYLNDPATKERAEQLVKDAEKIIESADAIERRVKALRSSEVLSDRPRDNFNFPIYTKVVGVTHGDRQSYLKESESGDKLIVKHSPSDEYPEATAIINKRTGKQLGFIKSEFAERLVDCFGEKFVLFGEITDITGGDDDCPTLGCNIIIEGVATD